MTLRATIDAQLDYLICGFVVLAASEAASDGKWLFESNWQPETIAVFGTLAWCAAMSFPDAPASCSNVSSYEDFSSPLKRLCWPIKHTALEIGERRCSRIGIARSRRKRETAF